MRKVLIFIIVLLFSNISFAIRVTGVVKSHGVQVGNTNLEFVDAQQNYYEVKCDFLGKYSIELPIGYYRVYLEDSDYKLSSFHQKIYSFQKEEVLNFEVEEKEKEIEGMVLDEQGYPIKKAEIVVKTSKGTKKIQSDHYGKFEVKTYSDLITIFAYKEGFIEGGEVIFVPQRQSLKNIQIILRKQYSFIRGIVTDGVKPLSGVVVRLRNQNLETLDEVFSDLLGYYEFRKVENNRLVALSVYEENFEEYWSDFFYVDKNYEKEHIILHKKQS